MVVSMVGKACLVCYYGPAGRTGICCNDHATVEETAHNGGTSASSFGQWNTLGVESHITVVVGEVETAHDVCMCGKVGGGGGVGEENAGPGSVSD